MKTHKPHMQHLANHSDKMHQSKPNQLKKNKKHIHLMKVKYKQEK